MTGTELERTMRLLEPVYDMVRVVDPSVTEGRTLADEGGLDAPHTCFALLEKGRRCKNCISARTVGGCCSVSKFEFVDNNAYYISTRYVEVDGKPLSLELIKRIDDGTLMAPATETATDGASAMDDLRDQAQRNDDRLFTDESTGAFNRRYLDESIATLGGSEVAMLKAESLEDVDADASGGRSRLSSIIAGTIKENIQETDTVIHYSTDTFVIVFEGVPHSSFESRLNTIRDAVVKALEEHPESHGIEIVMGAVMIHDSMTHLVERAQGALQEARKRNLPLVLVTDGTEDDSGEGDEGERIAPRPGAHATSFDPLTGLLAPAVFRHRLQDLIDSLDEEGEPLFCVHFDIENFKSYNRAFGLPQGDVLLEDLAEIIQEAFAGDDCSRVGIDTFSVATCADDIPERAAKIRMELMHLRHEVALELKCGIYHVHDSSIDATRAMDRAKIACDSIKGRFDLTYRVFDEKLAHHVTIRNYLVETLDEAIATGAIRPHYQPIVRAFTTRACAFEALSRWIDPELGQISPADVIPTLEEAHLIHKHDIHIVNCVCADLRDRIDQGKQVLPVTVNLSRLDFGLCDVFDEVERSVTTHGIDRSLIGIEVTESALTDTASTFQREVERFRDAGYEVWIDDFGSGYSSLNVLKDFDFDVLKIDMAFLHGLDENRSSKEILCTIVDMAKRIGIRTLAEGVETQAQYDFLRNIGCEMIQGYLFGRPMPVERAIADIAVSLEDGHERAYLDSVGRVNLLSQAPHEAVDPTRGSDGAPLAIIDYDGESFHYFAGNAAYLAYLDGRGVASISAVETAINADDTARSALRDMAHSLSTTGDEGIVEFDLMGRRCRYTMRYVASGTRSHAFLVSPLMAS